MSQPDPKAAVTRPPRGGRAGTRMSQARWREILDAATRLFKAQGFAATSMQDVSDAVGLLKGSLYYYFRSKEELLFEVLRDLHAGGVAIVEDVRFGSDDPMRELETYLRRLTVYAGEHQDRLAIFFRDFLFVPAEYRDAIIAERDMYEITARRLIEEAQAKGRISPSVDAKVMALSILGASSVTHEWYRPDGPMALADIAEQVASSIIHGVAGAGRSAAEPSR